MQSLTFLFTDIEGSTRKWQEHQAQMRDALARHDAILLECVGSHGGTVVKHTGDGVMVVFTGDGDPVGCALEMQRRLQSEDWSGVEGLRVRMGIHVGEAQRRGDDYFGPTVNRTARLMSAAWGGQILVSEEASKRLGSPGGCTMKDLGAHMLKDLLQPQRIYSVCDGRLSISEFPCIRSLSAKPHNLPGQPTPFVGRETEVEKVRTMLGTPDCRLVTILAPGGAGKTRLALQVAAESIDSFVDGVFFVPLEDLESGLLVAPAVASALGLTFSGPRQEMEQLLRFLVGKELLLVLDNFEHLTDDAALVSSLLRASEGVRILVTSRHRLSLREEWIFELTGLELPPDELLEDIEEHDSTRLFLQNACRIDASFGPTDEASRRAISRICRMVDGLPLAIELASRWVRMLTPEEIEKELGRSMEILQASLVDMPGRQRSIRGVFDYSWELLDDDERKALIRVSVFRGGFDRDAASSVAGTSLLPLSKLMDKSLLRRSNDRFELHGLLRQFAEEKLRDELPAEEVDALLDAHSDYYAGFLSEVGPMLDGGGQTKALDRISGELENVRAGWRRAVLSSTPAVLETYMQGLGRFYEMRSRFHEGLELFSEGAAEMQRQASLSHRKDSERTRLSALMLMKQGVFSLFLASYEQAERLVSSAMTALRETDSAMEVATCLKLLGNVAFRKGNLAQAREVWTRNLEMLRESGSSKGIAAVLSALGSVARTMGEFDRSRELFLEALEVARRSGDRYSESGILSNLGSLADSVGETQWARELFESSLSIRRELGDLKGIATTLDWLGDLSRDYSDPEAALGLYRESLEIQERIGDRLGCARSLSSMGEVFLEGGDPDSAAGLFQEAFEISREIGNNWGMATTLENRGRVALEKGDASGAEDLLGQSLAIHREIGEARSLVSVLGRLSIALLLQGRVDEASSIVLEGASQVIELGLFEAAPLFLSAAVAILEEEEGIGHTGLRRKCVEWLRGCGALDAPVMSLLGRMDVDTGGEPRGGKDDPAPMLSELVDLLSSGRHG